MIPVPSSINLSTPLLAHYPMVTSLLDQRKAIIRPMKDGDGKRTFELGPMVTMSCHPWDSNAKPNQPNPPQQYSTIPSLSNKQSPRQPTPGPSVTQWLEDIFCNKKTPFPFLILTSASRELTLPHFVEPSQHNEPPIPGPSQPSKPHKEALTCGPEPELAPRKSMEEAFG
ncbi:hypothetical protein O181_033227 [Austropuccinia psidii MF-1]|uniref:Uncharacterized protein n=1 Tax=Austropuccinia psidii MF-1 TaxID=1389203 RepID=A0A9Q3H6Z0_9BASI|nr:hypothetical protein [Austropuccinia psidii MF-1]